ncbi:MAG: class I SAM-dependent methyltransferase [Sphingobacteriaceae bacterium]|nr:class I SAM-dependent methyltransferase [Sphingobacteriaceae bacterium]
MSKWLLKYNYPQLVFAKQISGYLLKSGKSIGTIIDCPCGNGETAWQIAKLTQAKVIAADISVESIQRAQQHFSGAGIRYEACTIEHVLNTEKQFDAFYY